MIDRIRLTDTQQPGCIASRRRAGREGVTSSSEPAGESDLRVTADQWQKLEQNLGFKRRHDRQNWDRFWCHGAGASCGWSCWYRTVLGVRRWLARIGPLDNYDGMHWRTSRGAGMSSGVRAWAWGWRPAGGDFLWQSAGAGTPGDGAPSCGQCLWVGLDCAVLTRCEEHGGAGPVLVLFDRSMSMSRWIAPRDVRRNAGGFGSCPAMDWENGGYSRIHDMGDGARIFGAGIAARR